MAETAAQPARKLAVQRDQRPTWEGTGEEGALRLIVDSIPAGFSSVVSFRRASIDRRPGGGNDRGGE
jgi:hypothetical protein